MSRFIGIAHRIKQTADQQARPTKVCILDGKREVCHDLATETDELDFLLGWFPVEFRPVEEQEDISGFLEHQVKWQKVRKGQDVSDRHPSQLHQEDRKELVAVKVPLQFTGFEPGDTVSMLLGGSGDRFGFAIARLGQEQGFELKRIAPAKFMSLREQWNRDHNRKINDKNFDHVLVAQLARDKAELFQLITPVDRSSMRIKFLFQLRKDAMKDRIACEQRLRQRFIGRIFFSPEGGYPEGNLEDEFVQVKANDFALRSLIKVEDDRNTELEKVIRQHPVFQQIFEGIRGVGPRIAAPIIALVGDPRRFPNAGHFKSYCGIAPSGDGKFRRRRSGQVANWSGDIRQALYLFADQMNYNPDSEWGQKLRSEKARLRQVHPNVVCKECGCTWDDCSEQKTHTRKYTDAHIHKMAVWHTLGLFCEWLYGRMVEVYDQLDQTTDQAING